MIIPHSNIWAVPSVAMLPVAKGINIPTNTKFYCMDKIPSALSMSATKVPNYIQHCDHGQQGHSGKFSIAMKALISTFFVLAICEFANQCTAKWIKAYWPQRVAVVPYRESTVLLEGGHTIDPVAIGMEQSQTFTRTVARYIPTLPWVFSLFNWYHKI